MLDQQPSWNIRKIFQGCFSFCLVLFFRLGDGKSIRPEAGKFHPKYRNNFFFQKNIRIFFRVIFFCFLGLGAGKFKFLGWKNSHLRAIDVAMMEFFLNFCKYFKWTFYDTITIVSVSKHGLGTLLGLIEVKRLALDSSANP